MSKRLTKDQIAVLRIIRLLPGASAGAIEWFAIGGGFKNGLPVATNLGVVDPTQFAKAKKSGSRAAEIGQQVVRRKGARFSLTGDSTEVGYWPVTGGVRSVPVPAGERVEVSAGMAVADGSSVLNGQAMSDRLSEFDYLED